MTATSRHPSACGGSVVEAGGDDAGPSLASTDGLGGACVGAPEGAPVGAVLGAPAVGRGPEGVLAVGLVVGAPEPPLQPMSASRRTRQIGVLADDGMARQRRNMACEA
jgi:hypothetical protein